MQVEEKATHAKKNLQSPWRWPTFKAETCREINS